MYKNILSTVYRFKILLIKIIIVSPVNYKIQNNSFDFIKNQIESSFTYTIHKNIINITNIHKSSKIIG